MTTRPASARLGPLAIPGIASIGAGAINATAAGTHGEHTSALVIFTIVAVFQIGWGAFALSRANPELLIVGVAGNAAAVAAWGLANVAGVELVDGIGGANDGSIQEGIAALLAAGAIGGTLLVRSSAHGSTSSRPAMLAVSTTTVFVAVLALTSMVTIDEHAHSDAVAHGHGAHRASAVPPRAYDPAKPLDLGGVEGVTEAEQARAENLVSLTLARLPQFAEPAAATASGYRPLDAGLTKDEHYMNWQYVNDDRVLDPDHPESLVYHVDGRERRLVAAMFVLREGSTMADVPELGGALTRWHVHNDLCLTDEVEPRLVRAVAASARCAPGTSKRLASPMIHVWIVPHRCGPFAEIEGVGRRARAPRAPTCAHAHGASRPS